MSKKRIILLIISVLLIIFGIYTVNLGNKGPEDIETCTGKLTLLEAAEDPDFDIKVDSPILIRKVEMYQYVNEHQNSKTFKKDFSNKHESQVKITIGKKEYRYKNPVFPDEPKSEIFCGKVKIGDSDLLLSDEILEKFSLGSYVNFEKQPKKLTVSGLKDGKSAFGFAPLSDDVYSNRGNQSWDIGDMRIK